MSTTKRFLGLALSATVLAVGVAGQSTLPAGAQDGTATAAATISGTMAATISATGEATMVATSTYTTPAVTPFPAVNGAKPRLNVYNWTTYIAPDTVENFSSAYGVDVTYDTYGGMDELYAKMLAGNPGYDVIVPADYTVQQMIAADLLEEIDLSKIPNFTQYASEQFKNPTFDPGNKYCVAYQWGTIAIGYNIAKTGREITSWNDIFAPEFAGRVALYNVSRDTLAIGLIMTGKDVNTTNREDLEGAKNWLLERKDAIASFHEDDGQTRLLRGDVDIVMEYSGDIFQAQAENPDIRYVVPVEGALVWTDNLCIPKGAQNIEAAHAFFNYVYDPKVGADISNFTQYASPNQGAIDFGLIPAEVVNNPSIYPTSETKLSGLVDVGDAQAIWDEVFADFKASIAQ